jgi:hypothetical protein
MIFTFKKREREKRKDGDGPIACWEEELGFLSLPVKRVQGKDSTLPAFFI